MFTITKKLVVGAIALTTLHSAASAQTETCELKGTMLNYMTNNMSNGDVGFLLKEVNGETLTEFSSSPYFEPASALKVLFHFHAMKEIQNYSASLYGNVNWEKDLNDDRPSAPPRFQNYCIPDNPVTENNQMQYVLQGMMQQSDNRHTQAIRDYFGDASILQTASSLGMTTTELNHNMGCFCEHRIENKTTLSDLANVYEAVANGEIQGVFRDWFYYLMLNENNSNLMNAIENKIDEINNQNFNLSPSVIADFKSRIELAHKGGSYTCIDGAGNGTYWQSNAGMIELPFKSKSNVVENKTYVFGMYYDGASSITTGNHATVVKLLEEQIASSLGSWAVGSFPISKRGSFYAGYVNSYGGYNTYDEVVDIEHVGLHQLLVAHRNAAGQLELNLWQGDADGYVMNNEATAYGDYVTKIKLKMISQNRWVTAARLNNDDLKVSIWMMDGSGNITETDSETFGGVEDLDIWIANSDRIVTPLAMKGSNTLKLVTWQVDWDQISFLSSLDNGTATHVSVDGIGFGRFALGSRDVAGNMNLQVWYFGFDSSLTLNASASGPAVKDVKVTRVSPYRIMTDAILSTNEHQSTSWDFCTNYSLELKEIDTHNRFWSSGLETYSAGGQLTITANRYYGYNTMLLSTQSTVSGGHIFETSDRTEYPIGQVAMSGYGFSGARLFTTAATNTSGQLYLTIWDIPFSQIPPATPLAVENTVSEKALQVASVYPNPFNEQLTIPVSLNENQNVQVRILNSVGQVIEVIADQDMSVGQHTITWTPQSISSGTYICEIVAGELVQRQTVVYLR